MIRMSIFCQVKRRNFLALLDMLANSREFRYYRGTFNREKLRESFFQPFLF